MDSTFIKEQIDYSRSCLKSIYNIILTIQTQIIYRKNEIIYLRDAIHNLDVQICDIRKSRLYREKSLENLQYKRLVIHGTISQQILQQKIDLITGYIQSNETIICEYQEEIEQILDQIQLKEQQITNLQLQIEDLQQDITSEKDFQTKLALKLNDFTN